MHIMTYKSYEARIQRIAEVTKGLRKCAKLIVALVLMTVFMTAGYLVAKGAVIGGVTCAPVMAYGDDANPTVTVLMGSADYEYAPEGSDEWVKDAPTMPGKYRVRAVTKRSFGRVSYSEPTAFTIQPKRVTVTVSESAIAYGATPTVSAELSPGDRVESVSLEFENLAVSPNTPVHISKETIRIVNESGKDVTSAYELTTLDRVVAIVPRPITVVTESGEREYDGTPVAFDSWTLAEGSLVEGDTLEMTFDHSAIFISEEAVENKATDMVIRNADGEDVTHFYSITPQWGSLVVKPRPLTVTTPDQSWTYVKEKAPAAGEIAVVGTPLPEGHRIVQDEFVMPTEPGVYSNFRKLTVLNADGQDVTANFVINEGREDHENWGTITVDRLPLVVTTPGKKKSGVYDGTPFSYVPTTEAEIEQMFISGGVMLPAGYTVEIDESTVTYVTTATSEEGVENRFAIRILKTVVENGAERQVDVTDAHFQIEYVYGKLMVEPMELTVTTPSMSLIYNGLPQSCVDGVLNSVRLQGLPYGHTAEIADFTQVTDCAEGRVENAVTLRIRNGKGEDVTDSFVLHGEYGFISIEPLEITIVPKKAGKTYDGTPLTSSEAVVAEGSPNQIPFERYVIRITDTDDQNSLITVGSKRVTNYGYQILDAAGVDRTANFTVTRNEGILTVDPLAITITPADVEKIYDGTPLTGSTVLADLLPADHSVESVSFAGSRTDVGESPCEIISWRILNGAGEDVTYCFEVSTGTGKLTVTPLELTITTASRSYAYNGRPQGMTREELEDEVRRSIGNRLPESFTYEISEPVTITNVSESGAKNSATVVRVCNAAGEVVSEKNFRITYEYGSLTMTKRKLTVKPAAVTKDYDGKPLNGYEKYTLENILSELGHKLVLPADKTGFASITEVGSAPNTFPDSGYRVMAGTVEVTDNYDITVDAEAAARATLTINKRSITLSIEHLETVYNGELHAPAVNVTSKLKLVEYSGTDVYGSYTIRHELVCQAANMKRNVTDTPASYGTADYVVLSRKYRANGTIESEINVTSNYTLELGQAGSLTITPARLELELESYSGIYDGLPHTVGASVQSGALYAYEITENGMTYRIIPQLVNNNEPQTRVMRDAGGNVLSMLNSVDSYTVVGYRYPVLGGNVSPQPTGGAIDLTANYDLTADAGGSLTIYPVEITIAPQSSRFIYNGEVQSLPLVPQFMSGRLVAGNTIQITLNGSARDVGETVASITGVIIMNGAEDVTDCYDITCETGTLIIAPRPITLQSTSNSKEFDGEPLSVETLNETTRNLVNGHTILGQNFASITRVGNTLNTFDVQILDKNGVDVTHNYSITKEYGILEITERRLTLTTENIQKQYDGTPLWGEESYVTLQGLPSTLSYELGNFNSITEVGTRSNSCTVIIRDRNGADVTDQCRIISNFGTLTVVCRPLNVTTPDASKAYDGTPLITDPALNQVENLAEGHRVVMESLAKNIYAEIDGQSQSEPNAWSIKILDAKGLDVTEQYAIETNFGILTIEKRRVTVITPDLSKTYDGLPLQATVEELQVRNMAPDHFLQMNESASITEISSELNRCVVTVHNALGEDVTNQHDLSYEYGTLTVIRPQIKISTPSIMKVYDGLPLISTSEDVMVEGLPTVLQLEVMATQNTIVDAGYRENTYEIRILDQDGNDVTDLCNITYEFGRLTVSHRILTVNIPNATKNYDGTPLTVDPALITVTGLADGHEFSFEINDSLTDPGTFICHLDSWSVTADGVDVSRNYEVIESGGTLTVIPPESPEEPEEPEEPEDPDEPEEPQEIIRLTVKPQEVRAFYDGNAHGPTEFWISEGRLPDGYTVTDIVYTEPQTEIGTYMSYILSLTIRNEQGEDVTESEFDVRFDHSYVIIEKSNLQVTTPSHTKYYDATPLTSHRDDIRVSGLLTGHYVIIESLASLTNVGRVENACTVKVVDSDGQDVTALYRVTYRYGTLTVNERFLNVITGTQSKEYDGTPLFCGAENIYSSGLANDHTLELVYVTSITEIDRVENVCTVRVLDQNGNDVSKWYTITYRYGELIVTQRNLHVTTESLEKRYDGTPLSGNPDHVTVSGLLDGHFSEVYDFATITDVGQEENSCEVTIRDANGNDVSHLYRVIHEFGTLTVEKPLVTVFSPNQQKIYDATPLVTDSDGIRVVGLLEGHTYYLNYVSSITDIGRKVNECVITILDGNRQDVTDFYEVKHSFGELIVEQRPLTVITPDDGKVYDGTPLNSDPGKITVEGLMDGHIYTVETDASITDIGTISNACTVTVFDGKEQDVTHLYQLVPDFGELTVYKRQLYIQTPSMEKVYDGQPLGCDPDQVTVSGLLEGHSYKVTGSASIIDVGVKTNSCDVIVYDEAGEDVTRLYNKNCTFGTLRVWGRDPIRLEITPYEVTATYDGLPHGPDRIWISNGQVLPAGYTITDVVFSDPYVEAGYHESYIVSLVIRNGEGVDVTNTEFVIEYRRAKVEIYAQTLTIETGSLSEKFDGGVHKNQTCKIVGGALMQGHTLHVTISATIRDYNPEEVTYNVIESFYIQDENGVIVLEGSSGDPNSFHLQRDETGEVLYAYEVIEEANYRIVIRYGTLTLTWR